MTFDLLFGLHLCQNNFIYVNISDIGMCREKFQLDQMQNGPLAAILNIDFNMNNIWQTVLDS